MEAVRGQKHPSEAKNGMKELHTINLPYKQGYVTPVPAAVVVNTYEFREAEDPSIL